MKTELVYTANNKRPCRTANMSLEVLGEEAIYWFVYIAQNQT